MKDPTRVRLGQSVDDAWRNEDATLLLNDKPTFFGGNLDTAMLYLLGYERPRYPVPSIQLTVEVWDDTVAVLAWNKLDQPCGEVVAAFIK